MTDQVHTKLENLKKILHDMQSVIIGYSGGVDSTFLAKVATDVLGEKALSVAAISESFSEHERQEAEKLAQDLGLNYTTVETSELENPEYRKNESNRCFYCKQELFVHLKQIAEQKGYTEILVGTNKDDLGDYRPGQQAAQLAGVRSPMVEADMSKDDIRLLSKEMNIPTWDKPAFACLSSRFPYGEEITKEKLTMVEKAESVLRELGFRQFRVRHHTHLARIEVPPEDMKKLVQHGKEVHERMKEIGYAYVAMDLKGYRSGSMNETLVQIDTSTNLVHT